MGELPVGAPREVFGVVDTHFPDEGPLLTSSPKEAREMMEDGPSLVLVRYVPESDYARACLAHAEQNKQTTAMMQAATETIASLRAALAAETGRGEALSAEREKVRQRDDAIRELCAVWDSTKTGVFAHKSAVEALRRFITVAEANNGE